MSVAITLVIQVNLETELVAEATITLVRFAMVNYGETDIIVGFEVCPDMSGRY